MDQLWMLKIFLNQLIGLKRGLLIQFKIKEDVAHAGHFQQLEQ
jgi:hypothetical protein